MTRFLPVCRFGLSIWILVAAAAPVLAEQRVGEPARLTVVSAAPDGEIASREEANEIRVVFSEPMVTLGPDPGAGHRAVLQVRQPFRHLSLVWDDDADLYAGCQTAAAVGYAIRSDRRHDGDRGERTAAGGALQVHLHDSNGEAAEDRLVPARRSRGRRDGDPAALQPAGPTSRRCISPHGAASAARVAAAAHDAARTAAVKFDPTAAGSLQCEGRADARGRRTPSAPRVAATRDRLGSEDVSAVVGSRRLRDGDGRPFRRAGCG